MQGQYTVKAIILVPTVAGCVYMAVTDKKTPWWVWIWAALFFSYVIASA